MHDDMEAEMIISGDMVVTRDGRIGLCVAVALDGKAAVRFVNNGPISFLYEGELRKAMVDEIEDSPLAGVECNQVGVTRDP